MDLHAASDRLVRRIATLSLGSSSSSWKTLAATRIPSSRFTASQRGALAHPACRSCRGFSSGPARRENDSAGRPDTQPSYKADIYQRRSTFADQILSNARPAPKDGAPRGILSQSSAEPRGSPDTPVPEASDASKTILAPSTAQAPAQLSERMSWASPRQMNMLVPNQASRNDIESINFPENPSGVSHIKAAPRPRVIQELDIHVKPRTGRTLAVNENMPADLGKKLRMLDMLVMRNRIRYEFKRQQFHERPGLRRKRLVSERWRRKFKTMFQTTASRVSDLKHQGW